MWRLRYVATSCLEVSWQHQPVLHLDNFRPQEPVRHLDISTVDFRSLCCSWTCLYYRGLCCTTGDEPYLDKKSLCYIWTYQDYRGLPIHYRGLCCTWAYLRNRGLSYTWTYLDKEGKRHQKKETSSCFCLCSSVFGEKFPTAEFWTIFAETSCWEVERK